MKFWSVRTFHLKNEVSIFLCCLFTVGGISEGLQFWGNRKPRRKENVCRCFPMTLLTEELSFNRCHFHVQPTTRAKSHLIFGPECILHSNSMRPVFLILTDLIALEVDLLVFYFNWQIISELFKYFKFLWRWKGLKPWLSYHDDETVLKHLKSFRYCSPLFLYKAALQYSFLNSQNTFFKSL